MLGRVRKALSKFDRGHQIVPKTQNFSGRGPCPDPRPWREMGYPLSSCPPPPQASGAPKYPFCSVQELDRSATRGGQDDTWGWAMVFFPCANFFFFFAPNQKQTFFPLRQILRNKQSFFPYNPIFLPVLWTNMLFFTVCWTNYFFITVSMFAEQSFSLPPPKKKHGAPPTYHLVGSLINTVPPSPTRMVAVRDSRNRRLPYIRETKYKYMLGQHSRPWHVPWERNWSSRDAACIIWHAYPTPFVHITLYYHPPSLPICTPY